MAVSSFTAVVFSRACVSQCVYFFACIELDALFQGLAYLDFFFFKNNPITTLKYFNNHLNSLILSNIPKTFKIYLKFSQKNLVD